MRVAIYTRVSTEEQAIHGISLQAQETALKEYADKHHMTVTDVYTDEGYSATTLDRPSLTRLLEDARKGKFEKLIFTKLDRLTRGVKNYYRIMEVLQENNIDWKTILEDYDSSTASGRLHINIMLSVAENESAVIKERINFVFQDKVRRKEVISGKKIIGYDIVDKHYAINEDEAELVRFIFEDYARTGNLKQTERNVYIRYRREDMNVWSITRILDRKLYTGIYEYRGEVIEDFAPAIISLDTYEHVQDIRKVTSRQKKRTNLNPFSRIVKCPYGRCIGIDRHIEKRKNRKSYTYMRCGSGSCNEIKKGKCNSPMSSLKYEVFEEKVIDALIDYLDNSYTLNPHENDSKSDDEVKRVSNMITSLKGKLSRLQDLYIDGMIEKDKYTDRYNSIKLEIKQLEERKAELSSHKSKLDSETLKVLRDCDIKDVYMNMTDEQKRTFWINAVTVIKVDKDWNISIIF